MNGRSHVMVSGMSTTISARSRGIPADIVGIPADQLAGMLDHVLADDGHAAAANPGSLYGIAQALEADLPPASADAVSDPGDDSGHEDMLPQLRVATAILAGARMTRAQTVAPSFPDFAAAEHRRRHRRKANSHLPEATTALPAPSSQAESDRLLLDEFGASVASPAGGWTAEPPPPALSAPSSPPDVTVLPSLPLVDEVMDAFIPPATPVPAESGDEIMAEPATEPPTTRQVKIHRKSSRKLRVKSQQPVPVVQPVEPAPAERSPAGAAPGKPDLKVKVKPKRRPRPATEIPPDEVVSETVAPKLAELTADNSAEQPSLVEIPLEPQRPESQVSEPTATEHPQEPNVLAARVEAIIAAYRPVPDGADRRGSVELPTDEAALAALLDDQGPQSDFAALDLLYSCWGKATHECDSRALLAVAHQLSRNFGLPGKLPMASSKAWKMLDSAVFAPEIAQRLADVGQFIADWQKTQRVFLILEFSEIELIEHLFEALSPADYPDLLAEVMNYKVLSNRRMGLLRRIPARLRRQAQGLLPDHKQDALVGLAHGKMLLQRIADPRGFAPIVEVANKMVEEVEKLMKQTANAGAPQSDGPPGGGQSLGRIG